MSELQDAVKRLRRHANGTSILKLYSYAHDCKLGNDHRVLANAYLDEHPEDDECDLSRQELLDLVRWVDRKLDQCDFPRYPNHGLRGSIQGSMHCVVADSQMYNRFVKLQKVVNEQLPLAKHIIKIREEMGLQADDDEPLTEEWLNAIEHNLGELSIVRSNRSDGTIWWLVMHAGRCLGTMATRGDVRLLCRALGIELKEIDDE